jgi:hypothetical protein
VPKTHDAAVQAIVEAERSGWAEFLALVSALSPEQARHPQYYSEGWSVKDLVAHVAGWLAEAGMVLEQMRMGTFTGRDFDVEAMNRQFLDADRDQPIMLVMAQAHAARHRLLHEVRALDGVNPEAGAWLSKAGPDHYAEHLPRLRAWVKELTGRDLT